MALYKWNEKNLTAATRVTFDQEDLYEKDLQDVVRDKPEVIEEGLFVIAEEYSNWEESGRSIDLLALDANGRLVVVELKRTLTGDHMDLQAVRYAAMVSNMTFDQVVQAHRKYLTSRDREADTATDEIKERLDGANADARLESKLPRIILASGDFSTELTTSVLWLNDNGLDIKCVRLDLYRSDERLYLDSSQVLPVPQAQDYQIRIRDKEKERRARGKGVEVYPGSEKFYDSIQLASKEHQKELRRLYEWAMTLKEKGQCSQFVTNLTTNGYGLKPIIQQNGKGYLITIYNPVRPESDRVAGEDHTRQSDPPKLAVWKQWFEQFAPDSIQPVEEKTGGPIGGGNYVKGPFTDKLLEALFEAHEEAARNINKRSE